MIDGMPGTGRCAVYGRLDARNLAVNSYGRCVYVVEKCMLIIYRSDSEVYVYFRASVPVADSPLCLRCPLQCRPKCRDLPYTYGNTPWVYRGAGPMESNSPAGTTTYVYTLSHNENDRDITERAQ